MRPQKKIEGKTGQKSLIARPYNKDDMLIIDVKNGESIDQALRRFKRKYRNVQIIKELRARKQFTKPSVQKRNERLKAVYREQRLRNLES